MENDFYQFKIKYRKQDEFGLKFSINFQKLNIQIISISDLPGPVPADEPDRVMEVKAFDPVDIWAWAYFAAKQKASVTLGTN